MTNYERIKNMSVEEMAQFMFDMVDCVSCTNKLQRSCRECGGDGRKCLQVTKKWLEDDVK